MTEVTEVGDGSDGLTAAEVFVSGTCCRGGFCWRDLMSLRFLLAALDADEVSDSGT